MRRKFCGGSSAEEVLRRKFCGGSSAEEVLRRKFCGGSSAEEVAAWRHHYHVCWQTCYLFLTLLRNCSTINRLVASTLCSRAKVYFIQLDVSYMVCTSNVLYFQHIEHTHNMTHNITLNNETLFILLLSYLSRSPFFFFFLKFIFNFPAFLTRHLSGIYIEYI